MTAAGPARYDARGGAVVGRDRGGLFNRPLYIANTDAFVLAGDRPAARFCSGSSVHGTFLAGLRRGGKTRWFHDTAGVTLECRAARARWVIRAPGVPGLAASLEVVAFGDSVGFGVRFRCEGAKAGDALVWTYGGALTWPGPQRNLNWEFDPHPLPSLSRVAFDRSHCVGNRIEIARGRFRLAPAGAPELATGGCCSAPGAQIWAADSLDAPPSFAAASFGGPEATLIAGCINLRAQPETTWAFDRFDRGRRKRASPRARFAAGLKRSAALASRIAVDTPDARLNAAASLVGAALDGAWYPPVFRHGCMLWNNRFPGWRTICGGTAAGWHERVRAEAAFYCGHQLRRSSNTGGTADPARLLTGPAPHSRFFGRGRILEDQGIYNMQSQFFDQLIHAWRWTGDAALEKILRPALELHLEWVRDCFDPDGDGLYESVINGWPTDSVWYGGGGATEETSYAYRGHVAARDLARRAGDGAAERRHEAACLRIRTAFRERLWIRAKGHAGLYREQGGLERLHEDAWLYSIFLPIDAGLVDAEDAAASLRYTETALQNDTGRLGGRRVWTSNFVPGIWSVRELWPGDNYHLALAYFRTGLANQGWEVFRGAFQHTVYDSAVPGDFGSPLGGTDFGDSTHMFARTLVEGLFGCVPDYPAGVLRIEPQFPGRWKHARLRTPDFSVAYERRRGSLVLKVSAARAARLDLRIAICAKEIVSVRADGRPCSWAALPGFGRTVVRIELSQRRGAEIEVKFAGPAPDFAPAVVNGRRSGAVTLRAAGAAISAFSDRQGALLGPVLRQGKVAARLSGAADSATVLAAVTYGTNPQWRLFRVTSGAAATPMSAKADAGGPTPPGGGRWLPVDLGRARNGDIREIFKQDYLSPRPPTQSIRIGRDGYSPWTFVYWDSRPPEIGLDRVPGMLTGGKRARLMTPQGVPFAWPAGPRNVAFTSRWDNWPGRISVPVGRAGTAAWFLVCGSTNPMQCRIANAVLRMRYADGVEETLDLVPPVNYWNLCPIRVKALAPGQENRDDYTAKTDAFCLPAVLPQTVQLGENCRAMLLSARLRPGVILERVVLETLSPEVIVGLMGVTLRRAPRRA